MLIFFLEVVLLSIRSCTCLSDSAAPYSHKQQYQLAFDFWESRIHEMPSHFSFNMHFPDCSCGWMSYNKYAYRPKELFYEIYIQVLAQFSIKLSLFHCVTDLYMCWRLIPTLFMVSTGEIILTSHICQYFALCFMHSYLFKVMIIVYSIIFRKCYFCLNYTFTVSINLDIIQPNWFL